MIEDLLTQHEGKTLEFKENLRATRGILCTVAAFANTAGGTLVVGVRDGTREVVGVENPLRAEEKMANIIADGIRPQLMPEIRIVSVRERELLLVEVPHLTGPYGLKSEPAEAGIYVRLGSTNRRAGPELAASMRLLSANRYFDELPCTQAAAEDFDTQAAADLFRGHPGKFNAAFCRTLGLLTAKAGRRHPSNGAILLFGRRRRTVFPDAVIRCARFQGGTTARFIDKMEVDEYLPRAIETALGFIRRHTVNGAEIRGARRRDVPEYPAAALREAVINAVVHADYTIGGMGIGVAIFDGRIEITNPGMLHFGLTLEDIYSGVSRLRNRVIGRVFRELGFIEQWGSGIGRMLAACEQAKLPPPLFEERGASFKVTLFNGKAADGIPQPPKWLGALEKHFLRHGEISTARAAKLWKVTSRTARTRLRRLLAAGVVAEIGTGPNDPAKVYVPKRGKP